MVSSKREKTSLLAIAYYNAGSQLEFLKSYKECIDTFWRAIRILERNFSPNYPLTLEFKKSLSKAIQKYQKHITWKGSKTTFTNLKESFVTKRVFNTNIRPTSAVTVSMKHRTQPMQGKSRRVRKNIRPITAKTRYTTGINKLNDSLINPFGSQDGEEWLFSLEEKPHFESVQQDSHDISKHNISSWAMNLLEKNTLENKNGVVSQMFGHSGRFKRPQSAKSEFPNMHSLRNKSKLGVTDYANLELKRIFEKEENIVQQNDKSFSLLSKPPVGRLNKGIRKQRPNLHKINDFESMIKAYNSEIDPRSTITSMNSTNRFGLTKRFPHRAIKAISQERKPTLRAYSSIGIHHPTFNNKRKKKNIIRPTASKLRAPKLKSFLQNAENLNDIKHQIMDDNNYTIG
jgi:hypothetical protein